jgi:hypothetical protein
MVSALEFLSSASPAHSAAIEGKVLTIGPAQDPPAGLASFQEIASFARKHDGEGYSIVRERLSSSHGRGNVDLLVIECEGPIDERQ